MALTPLNPISFAADNVVVTLSCAHTPEGHTGLAFHDENGHPYVYHLDGHCVVKLQPAQSLPTFWLAEPLRLRPIASKHVAVYVRSVVKWLSAMNNPDVAYGIDFIAARGSFDPNGQYRPPAGSTGLTCASFVTEILRGARILLIHEDTWMPSCANEAWGRDIARRFDQAATSYETVRPDLARIYRDRAAVIHASVNGLRLLPVQVAGAASLDPAAWPVSFDDVFGPADAARQQLAAVCSALT